MKRSIGLTLNDVSADLINKTPSARLPNGSSTIKKPIFGWVPIKKIEDSNKESKSAETPSIMSAALKANKPTTELIRGNIPKPQPSTLKIGRLKDAKQDMEEKGKTEKTKLCKGLRECEGKSKENIVNINTVEHMEGKEISENEETIRQSIRSYIDKFAEQSKGTTNQTFTKSTQNQMNIRMPYEMNQQGMQCMYAKSGAYVKRAAIEHDVMLDQNGYMTASKFGAYVVNDVVACAKELAGFGKVVQKEHIKKAIKQFYNESYSDCSSSDSSCSSDYSDYSDYSDSSYYD